MASQLCSTQLNSIKRAIDNSIALFGIVRASSLVSSAHLISAQLFSSHFISSKSRSNVRSAFWYSKGIDSALGYSHFLTSHPLISTHFISSKRAIELSIALFGIVKASSRLISARIDSLLFLSPHLHSNRLRSSHLISSKKPIDNSIGFLV